jgi:hypothetical protein
VGDQPRKEERQERKTFGLERGAGDVFDSFLGLDTDPFWDWIPTVATHQFYCAKDSGFWVYKTLDQWEAENPGVIEGLVSNNGLVRKSVGDGQNYTDTSFLNSRFNWLVKKTGPSLFNRWRWEQELVDGKTNGVLARYVDFSTGNGHIGGEPELQFWLHSDH